MTDKNQMTIWHTEVPPSLQHMGIGGKLVEEAVQLASRDSSRLRIVCPFAKEHLARHPDSRNVTDKARAAFVQQYLGLKWPEPNLYHAMFNTEMGESCTAAMLVSVSNSLSVTLSDFSFHYYHVRYGPRT